MAKWPKTPSYIDRFNALSPNSLLTPAHETAKAQKDIGLIIDELGHHELVDAYCSACHSLDIVRQQKASKARWTEILIWMSETQGMAELPDEDFDAVLSYLSQNYSN